MFLDFPDYFSDPMLLVIECWGCNVTVMGMGAIEVEVVGLVGFLGLRRSAEMLGPPCECRCFGAVGRARSAGHRSMCTGSVIMLVVSRALRCGA